MEGILLILLYTVLNIGESVAVKTYAKRYGDGGMLMNAVISLFAFAFFVVKDSVVPETFGINIPAGLLPYALINAVLFASGFYFAYVAFRIGPFGLTRLISSFSLMFSIFYGIFFLKEPTTAITYIGIALVVCAMVLMNYKGKSKSGAKEENGVSLKWLICLMISVFANGFIAILTKMQQIKFDGACDNEFQMISVGGSFLILALIGLISERKNLKSVIKTGAIWGGLAGLLNGAKNAAVIAVYLFLPLSTVSPLKTGLALIGAFLVSLIFYKEKYTLMQKIGVVLGVAAVVLLAL